MNWSNKHKQETFIVTLDIAYAVGIVDTAFCMQLWLMDKELEQ